MVSSHDGSVQTSHLWVIVSHLIIIFESRVFESSDLACYLLEDFIVF